jgi:hypothetical protein
LIILQVEIKALNWGLSVEVISFAQQAEASGSFTLVQLHVE